MTMHEQLLARFIRRIAVIQDTPDLIMIIAADADHLWACRSIVDPDAGAKGLPVTTIQRVCFRHGWELGDLREKLKPAAMALGILPATTPNDHYRVLGVRDKATPQEITQAFRSQAFHIHPDTSTRPPKNNPSFQDLMDAYDTLRNPVRKKFYDTRRRPQWREYPNRFLGADNRASVYGWYLGGLMIIFSLLLVLTLIINES